MKNFVIQLVDISLFFQRRHPDFIYLNSPIIELKKKKKERKKEKKSLNYFVKESSIHRKQSYLLEIVGSLQTQQSLHRINLNYLRL